jgi:uncharacterized protein
MVFTFSSVIDASIDDVFAWHTRPGAIYRLTPPWQPVKVVQEASSLRDGRAVLGLPGGLRWVAAHQPDGYDPPNSFADSLESLPLHWRHTHNFVPVASSGGDQATRVTDVVDTPVPARVLRPMFTYRHQQLAADLAALARARALGPDSLTIAVTGSSGLIGTALSALLSTSGHQVVRLVRRPARHPEERHWRPDDPSPELLDGVDAVIHLAGASIGGRFTEEHKQQIRDSRITPTRNLARLAAKAGPGLRAFVTASAIGIYGPDRGDELLTETSDRGEGFLADVVADWEDATTLAKDAGVRTVQVRTGIVQSPRGGMLRLLSPLFLAGLGGRLGDGKQWVSWIGLDDLADIYLRVVADTGLSGPVNAVAPDPVRNSDYTRTLAAVLHRPAVLPVPGLGPRLLLGREGATEVAQASQYVQPTRLLQAGYQFRQPNLEGELRHLFGRN